MDISTISLVQMPVGNMPMGVQLTDGGLGFVDSLMTAFQQIMGTEGGTPQLGDLLELFESKDNEAAMLSMAELINTQQLMPADTLQFIQSEILASTSTVTDRASLLKDFMLYSLSKYIDQPKLDVELMPEKPIMEVVSYIKGDTQQQAKQELSDAALILKSKTPQPKVKSLDKVDISQFGVWSERVGTAFSVESKDVDLSTIPAKNIIEQLDTGIKEGIKQGKDTLVIKLNPEGLGEVTVKLTSTSGKISVDISTASVYAQNALNSELATLKNSLSTHGAELGSLSYSGEQFSFQQGGQNHKNGHGSSSDNLSRDGSYHQKDDIATLEDYVKVMINVMTGT